MSGRIVAAIMSCWLAAASAAAEDQPGQLHGNPNWPQWRGPFSTGVAPDSDPPVEWSERRNVRWKTELPGNGHSTPIVWNDRIFVTAAVPYGEPVKPKPDTAPGAHDNSPVTQHHQFVALAIRRSDGKILWRRILRQELPHEGGHYSGSLASASPVTDGQLLFAFFGSRGLHCLDLDGELQWNKDFGPMQTKHAHGEGSSPVLHGDSLVVNWDHEGQSFVAAFDKRTGRQLWKVARNEVTSWATPIVVEHGKEAQLIVSGTQRLRSYDLATGRVIWECGGLSANIVASPVAADGWVFAASSYDTRALLAIKLDGAKGDITGTDRVAWTRTQGTPYVPSPLLYGGKLFYLRHYQGILSRVDAQTGADPIGPLRLGGIRDVYASPVGAANRIYVTDRLGMTIVISQGDVPRVLASNQLDDRFSASAAVAGNELFLRGEQFLYCIAEDPKP